MDKERLVFCLSAMTTVIIGIVLPSYTQVALRYHLTFTLSVKERGRMREYDAFSLYPSIGL